MARRLVIGCGVLALAAITACGGGEESPSVQASWLNEPIAAVRTSELVAGASEPLPHVENPALSEPGALAAGRSLYEAFNCAGCHGAAGGGGIGPPLADDQWIYGGELANIYATIVQGRPNGMPAFGPRMTGEGVWRLAAYVRSLSAGAGRGEQGDGERTGAGGLSGGGRETDAGPERGAGTGAQ